MRELGLIRKHAWQSDRHRAARKQRQRRLRVEGLEDRALLTIFFTPQGDTHGVVDGGGQKLGQVDWGMPLYTIFWGSYWGTSAGQTQQTALENSLNSIFYTQRQPLGSEAIWGSLSCGRAGLGQGRGQRL